MRQLFNYAFPLFLILTLLSACQSPQNAERIIYYYDVQGFLEGQMKELNSLDPLVEKQVDMNDNMEEKTLKISDWNKELAMFVQADLNKSYLRDMYTVTDSLAGTNKFKIYRAKEPHLSVKYLVLGMVDDQLNSLEAFIYNENYLYVSEKKFNLQCGPSKEGKWLIKAYQLQGKQKMIFTSEETFKLSGLLKL